MMAPVSLSLGLHHPQWGGVSMFGLNRPRTPTVTTTTKGITAADVRFSMTLDEY